jgi:hypothetical protein
MAARRSTPPPSRSRHEHDPQSVVEVRERRARDVLELGVELETEAVARWIGMALESWAHRADADEFPDS